MTLKSFDDADSDEARQFLLDRRGERLHPKRHRTLGRRKRLAAKKRQRVKHRLAVLIAARVKYHEAVAAFWRGELENHP